MDEGMEERRERKRRLEREARAEMLRLVGPVLVGASSAGGGTGEAAPLA